MKKETAVAIVEMARTYANRLVGCLKPVKEHGTEAEYLSYRKAIAHAMSDMQDALRNIFREYPDLDPHPDWKGWP